ncbi:conserved hypothetical protein [Bradyrhizobium sp. STM 3843]|uniref:hypothetical protein n=1 Tax=Bradyrhizobium sp. STM 3843 TaxID=551947 RepID=UPI0002405020|nr:hypothetical protein [Bradyrhizobium sp. STM 3843]CCE10559.1 conserved hypothetical protein [Bradyrhizobium sp. STM 3843]
MMKSSAVIMLTTLISNVTHLPVPDGLSFLSAGLSYNPTSSETTPDGVAPRGTGGGQIDRSCPTEITFTRALRYKDDASTVLDVATAPAPPDARRPVVVFFRAAAEEQLSLSTDVIRSAMCFAAAHGLVAVQVYYRENEKEWSEGTKDIAAAISWLTENADLFAANVSEIVPVGCGPSASRLLSIVIDKEFQLKGADIAGLILVSPAFRESDRSIERGLSNIKIPIVLAWSSSDAPDLRSTSERFRALLCEAGHCPRAAVIGQPGNPASVFDLDGTSVDLHGRLRQLIGQLDARGLP